MNKSRSNTFMGDDFLLTTNTARELYHGYAEKLPIIDYHCHTSPEEIYKDRHFKNISEIWLGGDHYKWRLMRSAGIDESFITGDAHDKEKFLKFASILPYAIGNPIYHWCHLELKKYFGYDRILSEKTADEVWELAKEKLADKNMGARGIITASNVEFIGTTDDPADSLEWHQKLSCDKSFKTVVAPSFRPDKAFDIEKENWCEYIKGLSSASNIDIDGIETLKNALSKRLEFFVKLGCRAADHGLSRLVFARADSKALDDLIKRRLSGGNVTPLEAEQFKTELLIFCAGEYRRLSVAMQIHFNCLRNPNSVMFSSLGPDTGFDTVGADFSGKEKLALLLNAIKCEVGLPKTILYSLDANDNAFIAALIASFQDGEAGKLQHGSAWWFNDHKTGMREQMTTLASLGILGNFVGMLTDSRSFLSYTRHEYFRRILAGLIGEWVEAGEYPDDIDFLGSLVADISYNNAKRYFSL